MLSECAAKNATDSSVRSSSLHWLALGHKGIVGATADIWPAITEPSRDLRSYSAIGTATCGTNRTVATAAAIACGWMGSGDLGSATSHAAATRSFRAFAFSAASATESSDATKTVQPSFNTHGAPSHCARQHSEHHQRRFCQRGGKLCTFGIFVIDCSRQFSGGSRVFPQQAKQHRCPPICCFSRRQCVGKDTYATAFEQCWKWFEPDQERHRGSRDAALRGDYFEQNWLQTQLSRVFAC